MTRFDQSDDGEHYVDEFNLNQRRSASRSVEERVDSEAFGLLGQRDEVVHLVGASVSVDQVRSMAVGRSKHWSVDQVSSPLMSFAEWSYG